MLMRHLKFFVTLAEEKHFGRAAQACNVTQPTLSQAIRKLEEDLGVALIIRNHRFLRLTPEGEKALLWGRQILSNYGDLQSDLAESGEGLKGLLRVGVIAAAMPAAGFLSEAFEAAHPQAAVETRSLSAQEIPGALERFEIDAGVTDLEAAPQEGFLHLPLYEERMVFACGRDHPLARRRVVNWAEAAQEPLCLLSDEPRVRKLLEEAAARAGLEIRPRASSDSFLGVASHLRGGGWCAIVPQSFAFVFGATELVLRDMADPAHRRRIGLVVADRSPQSPMAAAIRAALAKADFESRLGAAYRRLLIGEGVRPPSGRRVALSWDGGGRLRLDYEEAMKLSARNVLPGIVLEVVAGAVTSHVRIDVGGSVVTASITNAAVEELGLKAGVRAYAVVKASDVMVGVDE